MWFDLLMVIMLSSVIGLFLVAFFMRRWEWMPIILLPLVWYLPEQTSEGRLLENFVFARWFTLVVIPCIVMIQLIIIARIHKGFQTGRILTPLVVFMLFSVVSAIINECSIFDTIAFFLMYVRYPLLFIAIINMDISRRSVRNFIILFLLLVYIQIPEILYRYFVLDIRGDEISWSLGSWGTTNLGIYGIYALSLIIAINTIKRVNPIHLVGLFLLFIPAFYGEIKAFILWAPVVALVVAVYSSYRSRIAKFIVILCLVFFLAIMSFYLSRSWKVVHGYDSIAGFVETVGSAMEGNIGGESKRTMNRLGTLIQIWGHVSSEHKSLLFGMGPGASLVGNFSGQPGRLFNFLISFDALNQIGATLSDVGIIGLLLYLWLLVWILIIVLRRTYDKEDVQLMILRSAFSGIWFFYVIVGPLYHTVWRFDASSFIFYFIAAALFRRSSNNQLPARAGCRGGTSRGQ